MGGQAEQLGRRVKEGWRENMSLGEALRLAVAALGSGEGSSSRTIEAAQLEVAVLERDRPRRAFRRLNRQVLADLLAEGGEPPSADTTPQAAPDAGPAPEATEDTDQTATESSTDQSSTDESSADTSPAEESPTEESPTEEKPDEGPDASGTAPGTDH
jgi:proteasome alpha subunit